MKRDVHIEIDPKSGFCFGVVNAISKAEANLRKSGEVYSLGDIVHNRMEVQRLAKQGLKSAWYSDMAALKEKPLLIRAHGEPPSTYAEAETHGIRIIDATCPVVSRLQKTVAEAYASMRACGGQVVILGKQGHAEVVGLSGHANGEAIVIENMEDLGRIDFSRPIFLLSQTTQSLALFVSIKEEVEKRAADRGKVTVKDTICRQVASREEHIREFARKFDVVIFVSGRKSSNGKVLFEICREANPACHHIEESAELQSGWFDGVSSVGICGGTSTPHWLMEDVASAISALV